MDAVAVRRRIAGVVGSLARVGANGPPPRAERGFGDIDVSDLGVDTPYSVRMNLPPGPTDEHDFAAALEWCRSRPGRRGFRVDVAEPDWPQLHEAGLHPDGDMPICAMATSAVGQLPAGSDVAIGPPLDRADLVAGYGGWMADHELAARLIVPGDLLRPDRRFLVARIAGEPIGCALVWFAGGTAYLSDIGVVAGHRGHGHGLALTSAAARLAAGSDDVDLVWMFASDDGAALYERMGFHRLTPYRLFAPVGRPAIT